MKGLILGNNYTFAASGYEVGQSVFADVNADGLQDHLLPVCEHDANGRYFSFSRT